MCLLNFVLLLESPFLPLACLILSFMVQLKATSSQDTEVSPLSFCSYSLVVSDGGVGGLDSEPGKGRGDHSGSRLLLQRRDSRTRWMK